MASITPIEIIKKQTETEGWDQQAPIFLHLFYAKDVTDVPAVKAGQSPLSGHHKSRPHSFPNGGDAFSLFQGCPF